MSVVCNNCGNNSESGSKVCHVCGAPLDFSGGENKSFGETQIGATAASVATGVVKGGIITILVSSLMPLIFFGLVFFIIGLYSNVSTKLESKGYVETTGQLVEYADCYYEDNTELCSAVYKYEVNGIEYTGKGNLFQEPSKFKTTTTIKYDPSNPENYSINNSAPKFFMLIGALVLAELFFIIFIVIMVLAKTKKRKKIDDI